MCAECKVLLLATVLGLPLPQLALTAHEAPQPKPKLQSTPPPAARVDINRASVEELTKIPGITRTWAARIVRFRPYRTKIDLLDRGVLPSDEYDRIKDYVIAHRE